MINIDVSECFATVGGMLASNPNGCLNHYETVARNVGHSCVSATFARDLRTHIARDGYALISTDMRPSRKPTPAAITDEENGPYEAELLLCLVGGLLGRVSAYDVQHDGKPFHNIMPLKEHRSKQTFASSEVHLEMHTELAFHETPPSYLLLFCVRADEDGVAETYLYDGVVAASRLEAAHRSMLASESFMFGVDEGATVAGAAPSSLRAAIFDTQRFKLNRYDVDLCVPIDCEHRVAAEAFHNELQRLRVSVRLRPGEMLVIDNERMIHSRNTFRAKYDGNDRWLKRAFVCKE